MQPDSGRSVRPRRSALYVPGSNPRAIAKAMGVPADVLVFDLEDSVAPADKDTARDAVVAAVAGLAADPREIVIRVNSLDTSWVAHDIAAIAAARVDAVVIPKVTHTNDIRRTRAAFTAAGVPEEMQLWAMIETPAAVLNVATIGAIAALDVYPVTAFVVGTNDLAAAIGAPSRPDRAALVHALSQTVLAARAHGLVVLDGTYNDLTDREGLTAECKQGRDLGLDGKTVIHPSQVAIANEIFAPSHKELAWAQQVVDAFDRPENANAEVLKVGGRMVERLHERAARRVLALADAIDALENPPDEAVAPEEAPAATAAEAAPDPVAEEKTGD